MPKAPVDEQGDSKLWKGKVWASKYRQMASPTFHFARFQNPHHLELRAGIAARSDFRHVLMALFFR
jgi:hypothetical protein